MKETLRSIFERELNRLDEKSKEGPLSAGDVMSLQKLAASYKQLIDTNDDTVGECDVSSEDLLAILQGLKDDD